MEAAGIEPEDVATELLSNTEVAECSQPSAANALHDSEQ